MGRCARFVVLVAALLTVPAATAAGKDYAKRAYNIVPSGQWDFPAPAGADAADQARLYDSLTPLFDDVRKRDIEAYFKSSRLGVGPDGPTTIEETPRDDVVIERDRFNVPHVKADSYEAGIWAAGWILAGDRSLLIELARGNAYAAAVDVPGVTAVGLIFDFKSFAPSRRTQREVSKQVDLLKRKGREGRRVLRDIDTYIAGINAYLDETSSPNARWTRNDIIALNALKGQFLGEGGGREARNSAFLDNLRSTMPRRRADSVFRDLSQLKNKGAPTSIDGRFPYGKVPRKPRGNVVIDDDSFEEAPAVSAAVARGARRAAPEVTASNTLMINAGNSLSGNPLMVGGPQIGYIYPGFTLEIDMRAPGLRWRGATSAPFPGYLLIGRGKDFATTLTSASGDIIDQFALTLCGGSDVRYRYRGKCRPMKDFDAGTIDGEKVEFKTTRLGPVVGYATTSGRRVAIAEKRSSYGRDVLDQLFFRRLSNGSVKSPKTFFRAASKTPQTFNSFYIDDENVAEFTSGRFPVRHRKVNPLLPTKGTGKYDWRGFLKRRQHPHGKNPKDGTLTNWNNTAARGFASSDDDWGGKGSAARVDLLDHNLENLKRGGRRWNLADVASAMNAGATQDVRAILTVKRLRQLLGGSDAPSAQAQRMLDLLLAWRRAGGSRLDRNGDGLIDEPGAAIMDGAWDRIANAFMGARLNDDQLDQLDSLFSRFDAPPGGQYSGWYQYLERDLADLLGKRVRSPLRNSYCGRGDLRRCRASIWEAIRVAGEELTAEHGTADPSGWRADATAEEITFAPAPLIRMAYANRPSGYQQAITFKGGRR